MAGSQAPTPCSPQVLSHAGCQEPVPPDTRSPLGARFRSTSFTQMVLLNSVRTSGERQPALARFDAASYRCKRFRSRWQLPSRMASGYLDHHVDVNSACFSCVSLLSPQRRYLSSCLRFFSSLYSSLESHLISCLSLNVTRLVSSCGAQDTCTFALVLECESCSANGSGVVAYCGLPLPPILPQPTTCLLVPPAHEILHRHQALSLVSDTRVANMANPSQTPLLIHLAITLLLATNQFTMAYNLDPDSRESITSISKQMAEDLVSFYKGNELGQTPGLLPDPYYWWEAGAMMGTLIDYWYYTGDDAYNNITQQALLFQVGDTNDYMPRNQTRTEGNDDQGFWGLSVMSAAEYNFPNPPADKPQWLGLAQAVFNTQASRWDTEYCDGGLRWQIFSWNNGYDYKNSISQACFFALGARLALYTGNQTYADWADKAWDWMIDVKFINTTNWYVYDGASVNTNCTVLTPYQFTYNAGGMILGAAAMYNYTESQVWKDRLDNLVTGSKVFFTGPHNNIMAEVACESVGTCNVDEHSFKAYLSRWLANMTKWAPHTYNTIMPYLRASSIAAAKQCVGGKNKRMCGLIWSNNTYDGTTGVGQQMAALEITMANLIGESSAPFTADRGGTSQGDPGGGGSDLGRNTPNGPDYRPINGGDRFGAAILTILVIASVVGAIGFLLLDETTGQGPVAQVKGLYSSAKGFYSSASAAITTFAAGGGLAAAATAGRKRAGKEKVVVVNEKAVTNSKDSGRNGSLQGSNSNNTSPEAALVANRSVRHSRAGRRRLSNMPIGWPQNPSLRSSIVVAESSSAGASTEGSGGSNRAL